MRVVNIWKLVVSIFYHSKSGSRLICTLRGFWSDENNFIRADADNIACSSANTCQRLAAMLHSKYHDVAHHIASKLLQLPRGIVRPAWFRQFTVIDSQGWTCGLTNDRPTTYWRQQQAVDRDTLIRGENTEGKCIEPRHIESSFGCQPMSTNLPFTSMFLDPPLPQLNLPIDFG